ncbi:MAG: hypothetical protein V3T81_02010 [Thermoanaerobaculia bacterium]
MAPIRYSDLEVSGLLPAGWSLTVSAETADWNPQKRTWTLKVHDPAKVDWALVVKAVVVDKLGRLEALRQAIDRVYRHGLG